MALLATAVAGAVYVATLARGAFPGPAAERLARILGLDPTAGASHPVWHAVARLVAALPGGSAVGRVNGFSAFCGAVTIGLLYLLMTRLLGNAACGEHFEHDILRPEGDDEDRVAGVARDDDDPVVFDPARRQRIDRGVTLGSLAAAWALAFSTPFWAAATRCHPAPFDLLLLLGGACSLVRFWEFRGPLWVALAALCWGVGLVESPLFLLTLPLIPWCLVHVALHKRTGIRDAAAFAIAAGVMGLLIGFSAAWSNAARGGNDIALLPVVLQALGALRAGVAGMTRDSGVAMGVIETVIPVVLAAAVARRALSGPSFGMRCLHLLLALLTAAALTHLPFSPWPLLRENGHLPIFATLLTALSSGYLVAYGWIDSQTATGWDTDEAFIPCAPWLGKVIAGLVLAALVVAPGRSLPDADSRRGAFADAVAHDAVGQLADCNWVVGDGPLLAQIRIAAHTRGQVLHAIPASGAVPPHVLRRVLNDPALTEDGDRLRVSASAGAAAFVAEWLALKPDAVVRVAILGPADLWADAGYDSRPHGLFFRGVAGRREPLQAKDLAAYQASADLLHARLPLKQALTPELQRVRAVICRQASRILNDLGVAFEDAGLRCAAWDAYAEAHALAPDNLSVRLNQYALSQSGIHPELRAGLASEVSLMNCRPTAIPTASELTRLHGVLARPDHYAMQVRCARQASLPPSVRNSLQAVKEFGCEDELELRGLLEVTLRYRATPAVERRAGDAAIPYADLAATAVCEGRVREAQQWIVRATAAGVARSNLFLPRMAVRIASGRAEIARRELVATLTTSPDDLSTWTCLAAALSQLRVSTEFSAGALAGMRQAAGYSEHPATHVIQGLQLMRRGPSYYAPARISLRQALQLAPTLDSVRDTLLWLDLASLERSNLAQDAEEALVDAPEHAFANYVAATLALEQGDAVAAERRLRCSLASRTTVAGLTQLAEALRQQQRYSEAEETIRGALARDDRDPLAWRILGHLLLNGARYEEALDALRQADTLSPDAPCVQLLLACVYLHLRHPIEARQIASLHRQRWRELPDALRREEAAFDRLLAGFTSNATRRRTL